MNYWLMKTEPNTYSWDDLKNYPDRTDHWDGIRNYAARNNMREMKIGDQVFIYHSVVKPPSIIGIAQVVKEIYVDYTQFDPTQKYFDAKSKEENPRWEMVDVQAIKELDAPVSLTEMKTFPELENMALFKQSRLSVQPVSKAEWDFITEMRTVIAL